MTDKVVEIICALDAFVPLDNDDNDRALYLLLEGFDSLSGRERVMPAMFSLLERFPETSFGSPGPIVHALEATTGYEQLLKESLTRQPTDLTVWMVNRILNVENDTSKRSLWLQILNDVTLHTLSSKDVCESAREFFQLQNKRDQIKKN